MFRTVLFILCVGLIGRCSPAVQINRSSIADTLQMQTGYSLSPRDSGERYRYPSQVAIEDGINGDEAVALALWNNPTFQAELAGIAIAEADVLDAGIVSNPLLRYLSPNAGLMASGYINFAIDFLWQRPKRIAFAKSASHQQAATLLQRGYSLIRDVQVAYANLLLARERAAILNESARVRSDMNTLAVSRLRHGEISELEANTFRADSASAVDEYIRASLDTIVQYHTFISLLGFRVDTTMKIHTTSDSINRVVLSRDSFLLMAMAYQPELEASRMAIEAAGKRLGWEQSKIVAFTGTLGFQHISSSGGSKWIPHAFQPGVQVELPLFNRNQGRIARARAEIEQASLQYVALQQRIALDVINAYDQYEQALKSYDLWSTGVLRTLEETLQLVKLSYERGDISYLPVLEAMRQLLNGQLRQAEIRAAMRRSVSLLNYTIGKKNYNK